MLYLAMSCLQGRPMSAAALDLLALGPDGLQLTPGNAPTPGFLDTLARDGVASRTHHGFHPEAMKQRVWDGRKPGGHARTLVPAVRVLPARW